MRFCFTAFGVTINYVTKKSSSPQVAIRSGIFVFKLRQINIHFPFSVLSTAIVKRPKLQSNQILFSPFSSTDCVKFIRSQKKNPQLVYRGFIYNKKLTQANGHTTWRCSDVSKNKCRAVCLTHGSALVVARREHDHDDHRERIGTRTLYDVEDDLEEYVDINTADPLQMNLLNRMMKQDHTLVIEIASP